MLKRSQISLNRIIYPMPGMEDFFSITSALGLNKVELRNDIPGKEIIDGLSTERIRGLAEEHKIEILAINALQKFNLPDHLKDAFEELKGMIALARSIGCRAIVLCPNNDRSDRRARGQSLRDTIAALKVFGPLFEGSGILGYVEPLGFAESSLDSFFTAAQAIGEAGCSCYRIVYDTFHHYLGPDEGEAVEEKFDVSLLGIVHASGVDRDMEKKDMRDEHRVLITGNDRIGNLEQISRLSALGYDGDVSLEPFSAQVQGLEKQQFLKAVEQCIRILTR